jgi:hypothetical protein
MTAVATTSDLAQLAGMGWQELVGDGDFYASLPWLAYREISPPYGKVTYHVALDEHALPVAGLATALYSSDVGHVRFTRADLVLAAALERNGLGCLKTNAELMPNLYCGAPQIGFSRPVFRPELNLATRERAIEALLWAVEKSAAEKDAASIAFLYVDEEDLMLRRALTRDGYHEFLTTEHSVLSIDWTDFETYLGSVRHKRRYAVRREMRELNAAGVELRVEPLTEAVAAEIAPLIDNLDRKYASREGVSEPRDHAEIARLTTSLNQRIQMLGEDALVSVGVADGAVRGAAMLYRSGRHLFARDIGFDYAYQGPLPLYFGVLFYSPIAYAIAVGIRRIDYGIEFASEKTSRGCRASRQYGYIYSSDTVLQEHLRSVASKLAEVQETPTSEREWMPQR